MSKKNKNKNISYDKVFPSIGSLEIHRKPDLNEENEIESDYNFVQSRDRQSPHSDNKSWDKLVLAAIERASQVNPYLADLPLGSVVPAVEACNWQGNNDVRPRLWDQASKSFRLIDSGSMISATKKLPSDKEDNSFKLVAVNGSTIKTYGVRDIVIKIGRKEYKMPAVICDISQDILGSDFIYICECDLPRDIVTMLPVVFRCNSSLGAFCQEFCDCLQTAVAAVVSVPGHWSGIRMDCDVRPLSLRHSPLPSPPSQPTLVLVPP